jgi:DNA polymerase/3'-5' exonuclease PolX
MKEKRKDNPMEKFNLNLSPFLYNELKKVSEHIGIPISEIIRTGTLAYLTQLKKDYKIE